MITILVIVVLIGIGTDLANARINWSGIARTERMRLTPRGHFPDIGGIGGRIGRIGGSRINWSGIARTERMRYIPHGGFPLIGGYGYGGRDRTLRRVTGYGGLTMNVLRALDKSSISNRLVNHQISVENRMISMAERDQQIRAQNNTVLTRRGPIVLQIKKPETQENENQELRREIEALKIQLEELQKQVGK